MMHHEVSSRVNPTVPRLHLMLVLVHEAFSVSLPFSPLQNNKASMPVYGCGVENGSEASMPVYGCGVENGSEASMPVYGGGIVNLN